MHKHFQDSGRAGVRNSEVRPRHLAAFLSNSEAPTVDKNMRLPPSVRLSFSFPNGLQTLSPTVPPTFPLLPTRIRLQGWDPTLIVSQIILLQALHYLTFALIIFIFSVHSRAIGHHGISTDWVLDWRLWNGNRLNPGVFKDFRAANPEPDSSWFVLIKEIMKEQDGYKVDGKSLLVGVENFEYGKEVTMDTISRGLVRIAPSSYWSWGLAFAWVLASFVDIIYLYHIIRRPTHILDSALTLLAIHLVFSTMYTSQIPTSLFFYIITGISTIIQVVLAEQWCVWRDLAEGFSWAEQQASEYELLPSTNPSGGHAISRSDSGTSNKSVPQRAPTPAQLQNQSSTQAAPPKHHPHNSFSSFPKVDLESGHRSYQHSPDISVSSQVSGREGH